MNTNTIKDNTEIYKISTFNSILQKINHKPLIVSNIFSYVKDQPYKFMSLIEKDLMLKNSINSHFYNTKKNNLLSKELNENTQLIKAFSQMQINIRQNQKNPMNLKNTNDFEYFAINNKIDPSFIVYKSLYYLDIIKEENNNKKNSINPSNSAITEITCNEIKKQKNIQMAYLPYENNEYKDSALFCNNINIIKEIDELYCIIDDNENYENKNLPTINKDIIINDVYFIYIRGIKNINVFNAIERYLTLLKFNSFKQISLGISLFIIDWNKKITNSEIDKIPIIQMINYALINNIKLTYLIPVDLSIKLKWFSFNNIGTKLKAILGIYYIFEKQKIDEFVILNTNQFSIKEKNSNYKNIQDIENVKGKSLILKFEDFDNVDLNKIRFILDKIKINDIIIYINKNLNKILEKNINKLSLKKI